MPVVNWPITPSEAIADFAKRHPNPEASALLIWAFRSAEELCYLSDLDAAFDANRFVPGGYHQDLVDVAHARWAAVTCITALDLCAAGLARALGGHTGPKEFDVGCFVKPNKSRASVIDAMGSQPKTWINAVMRDPAFDRMTFVRHALIHRRLPRNLYEDGSKSPQRMALIINSQSIPVRRLVEDARDLAVRHLGNLLVLLQNL